MEALKFMASGIDGVWHIWTDALALEVNARFVVACTGGKVQCCNLVVSNTLRTTRFTSERQPSAAGAIAATWTVRSLNSEHAYYVKISSA